jgi:hypothetical protein
MARMNLNERTLIDVVGDDDRLRDLRPARRMTRLSDGASVFVNSGESAPSWR